jgi:hypothetical protein
MPNWVQNRITVIGPEKDLRAFAEHLKVKPRLFADEEIGLSFHSFVTDETLDEATYREGPTESKDYWYNWNNNHWNTKWDACEVTVYERGPHTPESGDAPTQLMAVDLEFSTAWSAPGPVFQAMSEQWPTLQFHVWWEEEQGFGEEFRLHSGGTILMLDSWDIPDCHDDYDRRGNAENCVCAWNEDKGDWYDDCPGKTNIVYTVDVITRYTVVADSEEKAILTVQAEESGYDLPDNSVVRGVLYSEDYKVTGSEEVSTDIE